MSPTSLEKAREAAKIMLSKKAQELSILDVRRVSSFADYFVIASGRSARQVQAIADHTLLELKRGGIRPMGVEGLKESQWVLLDYGDVVVHIFYAPVRDFYDLEGLWADAARMSVDDSGSDS